jgi:probable HAF family extracellular repeat protein
MTALGVPQFIRCVLAAIVAALALIVATSASAGPAANLSVDTPGVAGLLGVGPASSAADPAQALQAEDSAGEWFRPDRSGSRGHGFVRDARGFTTIDVRGASYTVAAGSNRRGQIVGDYLDARKRFHGFVRDGRRVRTIDFPGAEGTFATAIDDRGRVVGSYTDDRGTPAVRSAEHGFLLDEHGRFRRIDVPGATATRPLAINNRGQIAGEYVDRAGRSHGYLQDADGSVTTIDAPGAGTTVVTDLDDRGQVVGASVDAAQTTISAFLRDADGRFIPIAHPDAGFYGTVPEGINNQGQIAGTFSDANDRTHGFVLDDGAFTTVDAPGSPGNTQVLDIDDRGRLVGESGHVSYSYLASGRGQQLEIDAPAVASDTFAAGINNRGEIVGSSDRGAVRSYHGFLRDRWGRFRRIDVPGARSTAAARINDRRQIVGYYSDSNENPNAATDVRGFLLDANGRFTRIDVRDATATQPLGINNRGEIAGGYVDADGVHGFLRGRDGKMTTIDVRNAQVTVVFDVNDRGQTAGIYVDADGRLRGFVRERSGKVTTIDAPGAVQTRVRGINNRGQVAIDTVDAQLVHHGFVFDSGRFTEIRPRGAAGNGTLANDIDDRGRVLGYVL